MPKPIPDGYHTLTPAITFKDARKAIDFYKKAFGAKEELVMPGPGGRGIMHALLRIGDSSFMMGEENPQNPCKSAETLGASPISFYVYVPGVDAAFKKALAAGAEVRQPVEEMFWGDRVGTVKDPFGYSWMLATHTRDLTQEQIEAGAEAAMTAMAKK
jgi:PhnB protein